LAEMGGRAPWPRSLEPPVVPRRRAHERLAMNRRQKPRSRSAPGNLETERAALAGAAPHQHLAAVERDGVLHDREAESGPALLARARLVDAVEAFEDAREILRRDPRAGVLDLAPNPGFIAPQRDPHPPPLRVLHRVVDQVRHRLLEQRAISLQRD